MQDCDILLGPCSIQASIQEHGIVQHDPEKVVNSRDENILQRERGLEALSVLILAHVEIVWYSREVACPSTAGQER